MTKLVSTILVLSIICFSLLAFPPLVKASVVFLDNFSNGDFAGWSRTYVSPGSSQNVSGGIARFIVPIPNGGNCTYSYIIKDGFISTVNSTIVASEDVYIASVPNGCPQGNGAIFFFYVCDSTDLGANNGNFGVGIDGSSVWSLWIGGSSIYTYIFQTIGSPPVSNTWYHVVLTVDNPAQTVTLAANGTVVINATQQQFTDRTHPISVMAGMGENWWCTGSGQQEVDIANVILDISDADTPTQIPSQPANFNQDPTPLPDVFEFSQISIVLLLVLAQATAILFRKSFKRTSAKKDKP